MKFVSFISLICLPLLGFSQIDTKSLLREMIDLEGLTRTSEPYFTMAQTSSYDRASTVPGIESWFANADWGQYLRVEEHDGRKEYVMADLNGPGAVVRMWSANPAGIIRLYFDGEDVPRIRTSTEKFLKIFSPPFGYKALRASNLYFPFAYARSLKITVEDEHPNDASRMYYHIGYRTYADGTRVVTHDESKINREVLLGSVGSKLQFPHPYYSPTKTRDIDFRIGPDKSESFEIEEGKVASISRFEMIVDRPLLPLSNRWSDPRQSHNLLRGLRLVVEFDGEKTIDVPVADFFGSPPSGAPYWTFPMYVDASGRMTCRFVMPFKSKATVTLVNDSAVTTSGHLQLDLRPYEWKDNSLYFHAQWSGFQGSTRPFRDFNILDTKGSGKYVGTTYFVANPVGEWWGEGDEKIFVDGESFPSTFGTGTEDYFGYAWSDPTPYTGIAFHSQPNASTPGNYGLISNNRFHVIDPIPFQKSLKFDMEIWHWKETDAMFAATAYWYATPGSQGPRTVDDSLLVVPELDPRQPVRGAIEGEKMNIANKVGGTTEIQGGFFELSGGQQLWWLDAPVGGLMLLEFMVPADGIYNVYGSFCHATDYGIHALSINGVECGVFDFYNDGIKWQRISLGRLSLKKGRASLIIKSTGSNENASPKRNMFGLDYILLEKEGS